MRFSIGTRFFSAFLTFVFLTGLIILVAIRPLSELGSISTELMELEIPEVHNLWRIRILLTEIGTDVRHFLVDEAQAGPPLHIREKEARVKESLAAFRDLHRFPRQEEERLLGEFTTRYRAFEQATGSVVDLVQQGRGATARELVAGRWDSLHQETLESLGRLLDYEDQEILQTATLARTKRLSARRRMLVLAVSVMVLGIALALRLTWSVTRPITRLVQATERVARGELGSRAEVLTEDEIGLLARRFNDMLDQLNRSFEEQQRFYADASHELRTPLTVIRGEAEVALRGGDKSVQEYRETLGNVVTVAGQMGRFVDELRFLAGSEAGHLHYQMGTVDLAPLLGEITREIESVCVLKQVRLELDVQEPFVVWGDAPRLRQLFLILIDNAIRYTDPRGKVSVALKAETDRAEVTVSDTGIGIPKEDLPHIFERFYRGAARSGDQRIEGGTGLGLSIARSIVHAHRGEISVESTLDMGTTFWVLLPRVSFQGIEV